MSQPVAIPSIQDQAGRVGHGVACNERGRGRDRLCCRPILACRHRACRHSGATIERHRRLHIDRAGSRHRDEADASGDLAWYQRLGRRSPRAPGGWTRLLPLDAPPRLAGTVAIWWFALAVAQSHRRQDGGNLVPTRFPVGQHGSKFVVVNTHPPGEGGATTPAPDTSLFLQLGEFGHAARHRPRIHFYAYSDLRMRSLTHPQTPSIRQMVSWISRFRPCLRRQEES